MLVIWLLLFIAIGFVAAVLDYWDYEDMMLRYDYAYLEEQIHKYDE